MLLWFSEDGCFLGFEAEVQEMNSLILINYSEAGCNARTKKNKDKLRGRLFYVRGEKMNPLLSVARL